LFRYKYIYKYINEKKIKYTPIYIDILINIVFFFFLQFLGPLKSGKSTLLGRIYEELILKPSGSLREVKKIEKELQRRNQSLEKRYAWLMDESKIEKERYS